MQGFPEWRKSGGGVLPHLKIFGKVSLPIQSLSPHMFAPPPSPLIIPWLPYKFLCPPILLKKWKCFYPIKSKDLFFGQDKNNKKLMVVHVNILDKFVLKFLPPPHVWSNTTLRLLQSPLMGVGDSTFIDKRPKKNPVVWGSFRNIHKLI